MSSYETSTRQILVEIEDDLLGLIIINDQLVYITGKLDNTDSFTGIEMDAYTLTGQHGSMLVDDCSEDDLDDVDDENDGLDDDDDDDEDDLDDDDDSDYDSDDDKDDDNEGDGEDN